MIKHGKYLIALLTVFLLTSFTDQSATEKNRDNNKKKVTKVWLIGDSTMTDYSLEADYMIKKYPLKGWGQVFQQFMSSDSLFMIRQLIKTDSALVDDRARGGRSTRSFFEEGRWSDVYRSLQPGDLVLIQFGHNDAAVEKVERYTAIPGFKEFLRLYVNQSREKGAIPVLITPVARNYPWKDGKLQNVHGDYPEAMRSVARELNACLIDLTELSMAFFSSKGQEYTTFNYFMNIDSGRFEAYPAGIKDNTHFQPAGAEAVANIVFQAMKKLQPSETDKQTIKKNSGKK